MRIEALEPRQASWALRPLFFLLRRRFGKVLTPYKVWAHRPAAAIGMTFAMAGIEEWSKSIEPKLKRLASLRAAQLIGCPF
jgi:alkylhydroperoxidase family enzyme